MQYIYLATVFAGALVCLLAALLLFVRRKAGERSRVILSVIVLFSVFNYITRFISICCGENPEVVVSAKMLLIAYFMVISYVMYPIEVIYPGWLNLRKIFWLYASWLVLTLIYVVTSLAGVEFATYNSILEMLPSFGHFDVWFRLLIYLLIFSPILSIFFISRSQLYINSDRVWIKKYLIAFFLNIIAYMIVLMFKHPLLDILYYYVSVGCSLYIVYMELFDRLIVSNKETAKSLPIEKIVIDNKNAVLIDRLNIYLNNSKAWRDPDLTLNALASELFTNRTTLSNTLRESGYENYTHYINRLRIEDFIDQIQNGSWDNYKDAFFFVGFRSRGTALRNFRMFTGKTPSEYFSKDI
jgi:AraC-like DNA-binding protein